MNSASHNPLVVIPRKGTSMQLRLNVNRVEHPRCLDRHGTIATQGSDANTDIIHHAKHQSVAGLGEKEIIDSVSSKRGLIDSVSSKR